MSKPEPEAGCCFTFDPDIPEVGNLVVLLSGGPPLTVVDVCDDCGSVDVAWFNDDDLQIVTLPPEALRSYEVN